MLYHSNSSFVNAPHCYVIRTLSVLFVLWRNAVCIFCFTTPKFRLCFERRVWRLNFLINDADLKISLNAVTAELLSSVLYTKHASSHYFTLFIFQSFTLTEFIRLPESRSAISNKIFGPQTCLSVFAKLRKVNISYVMSVRSSVCPHGKYGLPLNEFYEIRY